MRSDSGVEADTLNDLLRVEPLHLGVGVELVEIADAQREICIGKQLDGLGFGGAHDERVDIFFERTLLQ